jgi:hypothetical protein
MAAVCRDQVHSPRQQQQRQGNQAVTPRRMDTSR